MMTIFRAQKILASIGYPISVDGTQSKSTRSCLADFQRKHGLVPSGDLDEATDKALQEVEEHAVPYFGSREDATGAEAQDGMGVRLFHVVASVIVAGGIGYYLGMRSRSRSEVFEVDPDIEEFYASGSEFIHRPKRYSFEVVEEEDFE